MRNKWVVLALALVVAGCGKHDNGSPDKGLTETQPIDEAQVHCELGWEIEGPPKYPNTPECIAYYKAHPDKAHGAVPAPKK